MIINRKHPTPSDHGDTPALFDTNRAFLPDPIHVSFLWFAWAYQPLEEGGSDARVQLCTPLAVWEDAPKPIGYLGKALDHRRTLLRGSATLVTGWGQNAGGAHRSSIMK